MQPSNFTFDEKKHVYFLSDKPLMGVTTVLGIISKPSLIQWAANMACNYILEHYDFDNIKQIVEEARKAHTRKKEKAADQGTDTHALIEKYVRWCIENFEGKAIPYDCVEPALVSFVNWAIESKIKFIESEKRMYSEEWWTAGTADLVFEQDDKRLLGDIKTQKKMWDRVPFIQMAAYSKMYEETTGEKIDGTCVILIPQDNPVVETHYCYAHEQDIKAFEAALTLYKSVPL